MSVALNLPYARVMHVLDIADGVRLAGDVPVPDDWVDIAAEAPEERAAWKAAEFRKAASP